MNRKTWFGSERVVGGVLGALLCAGVASAVDVTITNTMNFSALDGGPLDADGVENRQFLVNGNLTLRSLGTIILDEGPVYIIVTGNLRMQNSGAIRTPSVPTMDTGPFVQIVAGDLSMTDNSIIRSHGKSQGGTPFLLLLSLDMRKNAKIEAHSTAADGIGGFVFVQTSNFIRMVNTTNRITANGMHGGSVQLFASSFACDAMVINSTVNAVGFNGEGGLVILFSNGGMTFQDGQFRVAAIGTTSPGFVEIHTGEFVSPDPPQTNPPATVLVDGGVCVVGP